MARMSAFRCLGLVLLLTLFATASAQAFTDKKTDKNTEKKEREQFALSGTLRDFAPRGEEAGHPDFEVTEQEHLGPVMGSLAEELGSDRKPHYVGHGRHVTRPWSTAEKLPIHPGISDSRHKDRSGELGKPSTGAVDSSDSFDFWFRDVAGLNKSSPYELRFQQVQPRRWLYDDLQDPRLKHLRGFYPLDEKTKGKQRNHYFTFEITAGFDYEPGQDARMILTADDDTWLFIDGRLVLDLGGVHEPATQAVLLDRLELEPGLHRLDFFYANRHQGPPRLLFETNVKLLPWEKSETTEPAEPTLPPLGELVVTQAADPPAVMLVFDASRSMEKQAAAKPLVKSLVQALPVQHLAGLRLLGHWGIWLPRKLDPTAEPLSRQDPQLQEDTDLVVSVGQLNLERREALSAWINWCEPRGETPLVKALSAAIEDFPEKHTGPQTIVVFSDGHDSCDGDWQALADQLQQQDITLHLVSEAPAESNPLDALAAKFGGQRWTKSTLKQLTAALAQPTPVVEFAVIDVATEKQIASGQADGQPLELHAGTFRLEQSGTGKLLDTLEIKPGQRTTVRLDAQRNGSK